MCSEPATFSWVNSQTKRHQRRAHTPTGPEGHTGATLCGRNSLAVEPRGKQACGTKVFLKPPLPSLASGDGRCQEALRHLYFYLLKCNCAIIQLYLIAGGSPSTRQKGEGISIPTYDFFHMPTRITFFPAFELSSGQLRPIM